MAEAKTIKRRSGLPDVPADPTTGDMGLGLETVADALAEFMSYCSTPLTIGLQGDWGSGKTSLMNFVEARLGEQMKQARKKKLTERRYFQSIWFNTWAYSQFDREDHLSLSLMMNLTRELQRKVANVKNGDAVASTRFKSGVRKFGRAIFAATSSAASAVTGGAVDLDSIKTAFEDDDDAIDRARLFSDMRATFEDTVSAFLELTDSDRLVVFVDDLDRLKPVKAIEVLEVLKNFLDVPGCVYVLAIDYDVVVRGLSERKGYDMTSADGKSFFDKIIQVPFRMPTAVYKITEYVVARIEEAKLGGGKMRDFWLKPDGAYPNPNLDLLVRHSVGTNPRAIKRLMNLFTLQTLLAAREVGQNIAENRRMLLAFTCLQLSYHPVYQFLVRCGTNIDMGLVALNGIRELESGSGDEIDQLTEELAAEWETTMTDRDPGDLRAYVEKVADLRRRLVADHGYKARQFGDIHILSELTYRAIDLDGNWILCDAEKEFLSRLFRVANLVGEDDPDETSTRRKRATVSDMIAEASKNGVGELFNQALSAFRAPFKSRYASATGIGFTGDIEEGQCTLMRLVPPESSADIGVRFEVYVDRLAEHADVDPEAVAASLPVSGDEYEPWAGGPATLGGYLRDDADLARFVAMLTGQPSPAP